MAEPERPASPDDDVVEQRLAALDEMLGRLEQIPGATAELALEAVAALTDIYGEALSRSVELSADSTDITRRLVADHLVSTLLLLHGAHPDPVEQRVARALDQIRPRLESTGRDVELAGIRDGVALVRVSGGCGGCAGSSDTVAEAVTEAVLSAAPELSGVEQVSADRDRPVALIPPEALLRGPVRAGGTP